MQINFFKCLLDHMESQIWRKWCWFINSQKVIDKHKGFIKTESVTGEGSTFNDLLLF